MTNKFEFIISSPSGCGHAKELLNQFNSLVLKNWKISILEFEPNCTSFKTKFLTKNEIEHKRFNQINEFEMRKHAFLDSSAEWLIFLEDHTLLENDFFTNLENYVDQECAAPAATFYSKNGTQELIGSRAIYNWVWGASKISLFPSKPEPVCSAFLVNKNAALVEMQNQIYSLKKGELEMKVLPNLIQSSQMAESAKLCIIHFERVNLVTAMIAVASNARITGHLEKFLLPRKGWLQHMRFRYFHRSSKIKKLSKYSFIDSVTLELMALSSFLGVITGRLFGIGDAEIKLIQAHPKI